MRLRWTAVALVLASCGDPIEVGNASAKRQLAEDRKLAEIAGAIEGVWATTVDLNDLFLPLSRTPNPIPLVIELVLVRDEDGGELARSGTYRARCVGPICALSPTILGVPIGTDTLGDAVNEGGLYRVAALEPDGAAIAYFSPEDGSPAQTVQIASGGDRLETAFRQVQLLAFTRGSAP